MVGLRPDHRRGDWDRAWKMLHSSENRGELLI